MNLSILGHPLSRTTVELTGITDEMVRGSKSEEEVLRLFREFSEGAILVATMRHLIWAS